MIPNYKQLLIWVLISVGTFVACQLDEKIMIEKREVHNIFLGNVILKDIEIKE